MSNYDRKLRREYFAPGNELPRLSSSEAFGRLFQRLTAEEILNLLSGYSLIGSVPTIGTGEGEIPPELTGEAVLSWLEYYNGEGNFQASTWTPATATDLVAWLDAQDTSTMATTHNGSTVPGNGDRVGKWTSKDSNSRVFEQQTTSPDDYRPVLVTNAWHGFNAVRCDSGSANVTTNSRYLISVVDATTLMSVSQPLTMFIVAAPRVFASNAAFARDNDGNFVMRMTGTTNFNLQSGINAGGGSTVTTASNRLNTLYPHILMYQYSSGTVSGGELGLRTCVGGGTEAELTKSGNWSMTGKLGFPASTAATSKAQCDLFEAVVLSGATAGINAATRLAVGRYFATRYGLLWDGMPWTYRGAFSANRRAYEVYDLLATYHAADPRLFLTRATSVYRRQNLLTAPHHDVHTASRALTKLMFWNGTNLAAATYTDADGRVVAPVDALYSGTNRPSPATIAASLAAKPAGRRMLRTAEGNTALAIYRIVSSGRRALFDREFDHANRRGIDLSTYTTKIANSVAGEGQDWKDWWDDLVDEGALLDANNPIVDYVMLGGEVRPYFVSKQLGDQYGLSVTTLADVTTTNGSTSVGYTAHPLETEQPVKWSTGAPTPAANGTFYYARDTGANTFTLHPTPADANANTNAVSFTQTTSTSDLTVYTENWANIFRDSSWASVRDGDLKPNLAQSVWDTWSTWTYSSDERGFLFDAWSRKQQKTAIETAFAYPLTKIPGMQIGEYTAMDAAPGNRPTIAGFAYPVSPYGPMGAIFKSSVSLYGLLWANIWSWRDNNYTSTGALAGDERIWATFLQEMALLESMLAANNNRKDIWLSYWNTANDFDDDERMHRNLWLCSMLVDNDINVYNSNDGGSTTSLTNTEYQLFVNLAKERDEVVKYQGAVWATERAPIDPLADYDALAFYDLRVWARDKYVWRVVPNINAIDLRVRQSSSGIRFENSLGSLFIPGGSRATPRSGTNSTWGYWVYQR